MDRYIIFLVFVPKIINSCYENINSVGTIGYRQKYSSLEYEGFGFIGCAKECKRISGCTSFNYDKSKLSCGFIFLNESTSSSLISSENSIFSWVENWPDVCLESVNITCQPCWKAVKTSIGNTICIDIGLKHVNTNEVARLKETSFSSTLNAYTTSSSKAVNGIKTDCAITENTTNPYWYVNLGKNYNVAMVRIYNRIDCCGERLGNVDVLVGQTLEELELCNVFDGPGVTFGVYDIRCTPEPLLGQYVKIMIRHPSTYLQLTEVEVIDILREIATKVPARSLPVKDSLRLRYFICPVKTQKNTSVHDKYLKGDQLIDNLFKSVPSEV